MVLAYLVEAIQKKRLAQFGKATAVCIVAATLGVVINLSNLFHTWQYAKESMRGKSELVKKELCQPDFERTRPRLHNTMELRHRRDMDPARAQHQGRSVGTIGTKRESHGESRPQFYEIYQQLGQYWGNQPGTSGPVYVGAFVLMLFILGLFIVKGPMKWALFAATALSILLSWGTQLHVVHRPLPRLCAHVCQVPHGGIHPRHSRIHHPAACDDGTEEDS